MNSSEQQTLPEFPGSMLLITRLGLVSVLSGILIVLAYQLTLPQISANKHRTLQRSVLKLLPGAAGSQAFVATAGGGLNRGDDSSSGEKIYAAYDRNGKLLGVAVETVGQGYQDAVRILYAFNAERQCITGFEVLKSSETPGMGSKIATDPAFQANFKCLAARVNSALTALEHPLQTMRHGSKQQAWEIDAIAGATVTSYAVGTMLNASAQKWVPLIMRNMQVLRAGASAAFANQVPNVFEEHER